MVRPLTLTMQAFGPYAGKETIDFTKLENRTMFVISGKTGAGKTTIFDGISFAIYGKASGEDRNGQDMRSHFADPEELTEVTLKFHLRGKTYEIKRSPQQEKPKKSGEGFTTITARAELYEIDNEGKRHIIASNVRDVDEKIKDIIGLDANQFRQILMIPQGEFRKLLTAESKEKEGILQKLFHTFKYKKIEEKLKEESSLLKNRAEDLEREYQSLIRSIKADVQEDLRTEINKENPNKALVLELLQKEIQLQTEKIAFLQTEILQFEGESEKLKQEIFIAQDLLNKKKEKEALEKQKLELLAKEREIEGLKKQIRDARKAASISGIEQNYEKIGIQTKKAQESYTEAEKSFKQIERQVLEFEKQFREEESKAIQREEASNQVMKLEQLREAVYSLKMLQKEVSDIEATIRSHQTDCNKLESDFRSLSEKEEKIVLEMQKCEKTDVLLLEKERELDKSQTILDYFQKIEQLTKQYQEAENEFHIISQKWQFAKEKVEEAKKDLSALEYSWKSSHSGILASSLVDGEPCPVCGSPHHPNPAQFQENMPTELELKEAQQRVTDLDEKKSNAESQYYQANSNLDSIKKALEERERDLSKELSFYSRELRETLYQQLKQKIETIQQEKKNLIMQKEKLVELENQRKTIKQQQEQIDALLNQKREKLMTLQIAFAEKNTLLSSLLKSIPEEIRSWEAYEAALEKALRHKKELFDRFENVRERFYKAKEQEASTRAYLESSQKRLEELTNELKVVREEFKKELQVQGFESYQAYVAAKKSEDQIIALEERIERYVKEIQNVNSLLHELELKLKGVTIPSIEDLQAKLNSINERWNEASSRKQEYMINKRENENAAVKMEILKKKQEEIEQEFAIVGHLYEIAKGQNPFKITFERFVLAAFLDDILKEANIRLVKMTSGRYQLLRKIDPTRKNTQSGLELTVFDQYTGTERHVKTLSGGESFKASLALALGLAAVVQQHAGGVSLETMFIDEGFGTLDPESLDQAIEALMDIQSSGRLVGIISHVPELKERIDARLEVISSNKGSKTEFVFLG